VLSLSGWVLPSALEDVIVGLDGNTIIWLDRVVLPGLELDRAVAPGWYLPHYCPPLGPAGGSDAASSD
jgi:hypothetical protein